MPSETPIYSVMSDQFGGVSLILGCGGRLLESSD
jgi:hypothetical protein